MSLPNWKRNAQLFTALTSTDTTVGIYVGRSGDLSTVNVGDSTVDVRATTKYRPWPGDPVILTWTNGRLRLTGPAHTKSATGVVQSVGVPYITVACDDRSYRLPYAVSLEGGLKAGDKVAIDWAGNYVKDKVSADPPDVYAGPKLTTAQHPFTLYFFAKQSGSYKSFNPKGAAPAYSKWWTDDVHADDDDVAGWFYGNTIRKSLKNDAWISSLEVYLPVRSTKGAGLPKIGRHTQDTRPSGSLSVSDEATRHRKSGWVTLPKEWAETWRDSPGGIGVQHGGNTIFKGIHADRQSGKLRIRGRQ
jgi:hypothetical protein